MNPDVAVTLIQTGVALAVLVGTVRLLAEARRSVAVAFFAFGVASLVLSDLYWLTYDVLRPGTRMPFAANEIAEWAQFLLLGAALAVPEHRGAVSARGEMLCAGLFAAASAALWIAWSGEWVQDILTGVTYGYFLACLIARVKQTGALSARQRRLLGGACLVLIAGQTATFLAPETVKTPLDLFCYALLFACAAFFLARTVLSLKRGGDPARGVCLSFAALAWSYTVLYMSEGGFYHAALLVMTACYPLILRALRREAGV